MDSKKHVEEMLKQESMLKSLLACSVQVQQCLHQCDSAEQLIDDSLRLASASRTVVAAMLLTVGEPAVIRQSPHACLNFALLFQHFSSHEHDGFPGIRCATGQTVEIADNLEKLGFHTELNKLLEQENINAFIAFPLKGMEARIGDSALCLFLRKESVFHFEELNIYSDLAGIISQGIELIHLREQNRKLVEELKQQSITDPLTGVFNRRYMETVVNEEIKRCLRTRERFSVMMLDIDHFKHINDEHGHAVGDQVLIELTRRVSENLRQTDILGREGGEEFLVVSPCTDKTSALWLAERLRKCIVATEITDMALRVSCSIGVAEFKDSDTLETLLNRADNKLYQAKRDGRNQVKG